jgi:hypothetical protein
VTARPRLLVSIAAGLVVAVIAVLLIARSKDDAPEPLDIGSGGDLSQRLEDGQTFADADVYMFNRGDQPLTLDRVEVVARGPNIPSRFRFIVAGRHRTDDVLGGADLKCPPEFFKPASLRPLRGFVLHPRSTPEGEEGAVLITCFKAPPSPGHFEITHLRITYTSDSEQRTTTIPRVLAICTERRGKRCDPTPAET